MRHDLNKVMPFFMCACYIKCIVKDGLIFFWLVFKNVSNDGGAICLPRCSLRREENLKD